MLGLLGVNQSPERLELLAQFAPAAFDRIQARLALGVGCDLRAFAAQHFAQHNQVMIVSEQVGKARAAPRTSVAAPAASMLRAD